MIWHGRSVAKIIKLETKEKISFQIAKPPRIFFPALNKQDITILLCGLACSAPACRPSCIYPMEQANKQRIKINRMAWVNTTKQLRLGALPAAAGGIHEVASWRHRAQRRPYCTTRREVGCASIWYPVAVARRLRNRSCRWSCPHRNRGRPGGRRRRGRGQSTRPRAPHRGKRHLSIKLLPKIVSLSVYKLLAAVKKYSTYWSNISASLSSQRIDGYPLDQAAV